jgi:leucine-zipper-like transcriptional regulator 1
MIIRYSDLYLHCIKIIILITFPALLVSSCRKNHPPYTPYTPIGATTGRTNISYSFSTIPIDPDEDNVALRFDWGDGDTSGWSELGATEVIFMRHSWSFGDTYYVRAQAKDEKEKNSEWSLPLSVDIKENSQPFASAPVGPANGWVNSEYMFLTFATDPDSDSVAIRFSWGDGDTTEWSSYMPSGGWINTSNFWINPDTYQVQTQAKDIYGTMSSWSEPTTIIIGAVVWICATRHAAWSDRESHASVVLKDKMWVIGGHNRPGEVWSSPDGMRWTCETDSAGFGERDDHEAVVYDNKIWVIAGSHGDPVNDVWCSPDGVNWTCVITTAQWQPRYDFSAVVFDDKMWILGGIGENSVLNDVWYSEDGVNWYCAVESAPWSPRQDPAAVAFDNKIWVLGNGDIWSSPNGSEWYHDPNAQHFSQHWLTSVVYDNKMWIIGGRVSTTTLNDVWFSANGVEWVDDNAMVPFPPKCDHSSVVFNNKIWVMGGFDGSDHMTNDVWYRIVKYNTK